LKTVNNNTNEWAAAAAFSRQSIRFDDIYGDDGIVQYKRSRVQDHLVSFLSPQSRILELNAGTGEDAIHLARRGHSVHATDISAEMLQRLCEKKISLGLEKTISQEQCSFTALSFLQDRGPYDHIFSNFAGLNCTDKLSGVLGSLDSLLKPGGHITLVVLPGFCLWEFLLLFRGKFKTAFRRFSGKSGAAAKVEGLPFRCWYYGPSYIQKHLGRKYRLKKLEGLCTVVPPSYFEGFAERRPALFKRLARWEHGLKSRWPWRVIGDYYIITLQKKE
jgi:ubiquinone/menaquinone biosynthesis C-methylase UbiE